MPHKKENCKIMDDIYRKMILDHFILVGNNHHDDIRVAIAANILR